MDITKRIPVVESSSINRNDFEKYYLLPQKPVIIRGLWKQYPAYTKWTMDYFRRVMGDIEVDLFSSTLANPGETISKPHVKMKFADYLNLIEHSNTDLRIFLFQIFKHKPELLKDFGYPEITGRYLKIPFLFFGPKNSFTRMHQDIDMSNVFLTQFTGKRRVVLFAPDQSPFLYKLPFNVHSMVDITRPDYVAFPALKFAKGYDSVLEHGDTLFMPSGYWHHIEYIESGFGLSQRTLGHNLATILRGGYYVTIQHKVDTLMLKAYGNKWFDYKKSIAFKNAEKAVKMIDS